MLVEQFEMNAWVYPPETRKLNASRPGIKGGFTPGAHRRRAQPMAQSAGEFFAKGTVTGRQIEVPRNPERVREVTVPRPERTKTESESQIRGWCSGACRFWWSRSVPGDLCECQRGEVLAVLSLQSGPFAFGCIAVGNANQKNYELLNSRDSSST